MTEELLEKLYALLSLYFELAGDIKTGPIRSFAEIYKMETALDAVLLRKDILIMIDKLIQPRRKNTAYNDTYSLYHERKGEKS